MNPQEEAKNVGKNPSRSLPALYNEYEFNPRIKLDGGKSQYSHRLYFNLNQNTRGKNIILRSFIPPLIFFLVLSIFTKKYC